VNQAALGSVTTKTSRRYDRNDRLSWTITQIYAYRRSSGLVCLATRLGGEQEEHPCSCDDLTIMGPRWKQCGKGVSLQHCCCTPEALPRRQALQALDACWDCEVT